MLMLLPKRIALVFYRVSTYRQLVKILAVVGYILGLLLFFGLFVSPGDKQPEEDFYQAPTPKASANSPTEPEAVPPSDAGVPGDTPTRTTRATDAKKEAMEAVAEVREAMDAILGAERSRQVRQRLVEEAEKLGESHGMNDPETREKLRRLLQTESEP